MAQANYDRYAPYCSYNCQEWHNLERAQDYINTLRAVERTDGDNDE